MVTRGAGVGGGGAGSGTGPTAAVADWTLPTAAVAHTFARGARTDNFALLTSGSLFLTGIGLTAGQTISSITWFSSTTALATGTHQWFSLYSSALAKLGVTSNDTSGAWASEATKTLTLASPYVVPSSGLYYVGITVVASTVPSLRAASTSGRITLQEPVLSGTSTSGLTTPASAPATAAALTASGSAPYVYVS